MKKMIVVASMLAGIMLMTADLAPAQTAVPQGYLGELCFDLHPNLNADTSTLRLAVTSTGTSWQLNGRWVYEQSDLDYLITASIAIAGVMARDLGDRGLDISLNGYDYADVPGDALANGEFRFHAKINNSGVGTWKRIRNGFTSSGQITAMGICSTGSAAPTSSK